MAEGTASRSSRGHPYPLLADPGRSLSADRSRPSRVPTHARLDDVSRLMPEVFPPGFARGYELKDDRMSAKQGLPIRRILLKGGAAVGVEGALFLRKFGVPFRALARVFGEDPMSWYRLECGLGRFSVVGATVRRAGLPEHLLADEHHQAIDGQKVSIATTVAAGCCPGAEPSKTAGADDLKAAYGAFRAEARDIAPKYRPETVNTDGWKPTQAAWMALFKGVVILQCFLHAWLKIRGRGKHLGVVFAEVSRRVREAYHAPAGRRCPAERLNRHRYHDCWLQNLLVSASLDGYRRP